MDNRAARLSPLFLLASLSFACSSAPHDTPHGPASTSQQQQPGPNHTPAPTPQPEPVASAPNCAKTLFDYCAGASCTTSWSQASWNCRNPVPTRGPALPQWTMDNACGGFDLWISGGDGSTTSYYDSTGGLAAVTDSTGKCLGGPADFVAPTGCNLTPCGGSCGGVGPAVP